MADLSVTASITDLNTGATFAYAQATQVTQADSAKRKICDEIVTLATTATTLTLTSGGTVGYAEFTNQDAAITVYVTNASVAIGSVSTTNVLAKIPPGGVALIPLMNGIALYAVAASGTPNLRYSIWNA